MRNSARSMLRGLVTGILRGIEIASEVVRLDQQQIKKNPHRKVVVVGGGTGLSVLLRGLKEKPFDLTAIVTVADDGGSSGRLREEKSMPPPGDIRNVIVALAD